jgi:hypothetical protein
VLLVDEKLFSSGMVLIFFRFCTKPRFRACARVEPVTCTGKLSGYRSRFLPTALGLP